MASEFYSILRDVNLGKDENDTRPILIIAYGKFFQLSKDFCRENKIEHIPIETRAREGVSIDKVEQEGKVLIFESAPSYTDRRFDVHFLNNFRKAILFEAGPDPIPQVRARPIHMHSFGNEPVLTCSVTVINLIPLIPLIPPKL